MTCLLDRRMNEGGSEFFTEWEESFESFDQMNLHENLLRGIYAYGMLAVSREVMGAGGFQQPMRPEGLRTASPSSSAAQHALNCPGSHVVR